MKPHSLLFAALIGSTSASDLRSETVPLAENSSDVVSHIERHIVSIPKTFYVPYSGEFKDNFPEGIPFSPGSGIAFKKKQEDGSILLWAISDRGPNADYPDIVSGEGIKPTKVFPVPDYTPMLAEITITPGKGAVVSHVIAIKNTTGLPVSPGHIGSTGEVGLNDTIHPLPYDDQGIDPEGIVQAKNGSLWIVDEYGSSILQINSESGEILKKLTPGNGLPDIIKYRQANRGFEAIAITPQGKIYAALQSTLSVEEGSEKKARFIRIVEYDPISQKTRMLGFPIDTKAYKNNHNAKIGDMVALSDTQFVILEQGKRRDKTMHNTIYLMDIARATDLTFKKTGDGKELELASKEDLKEVAFIEKKPLVDLRGLGWMPEKAEGLALIDETTLAIINDNDFGLETDFEEGSPNSNITLANPEKKGRITIKATEESTELWLIHFKKPLADLF